MNRQLPRYLLDKYQLMWTVAFTALFALASLFVAAPFCDNIWLGTHPLPVYLLSGAFVLVALLVMILDRVAMYWTGRRGRLSIAAFGLWNLAEILFIAVIYACFTALYCLVDEDSGSMRWLRVFLGSCLFGLVGLGVPALVSSLIMTVVKKDNIVRLTDFSNIVTDSPEKPYEDKRITLFDGNGVLKISINEDNLYFIESDDNYIKVWYTDSVGEVKQYMLRCPLKTVEDSFAGSVLVRCHRKFIVNINKVCILKAEKEGYKITLGLDGVDAIPISRTYERSVLARFNSRQ